MIFDYSISEKGELYEEYVELTCKEDINFHVVLHHYSMPLDKYIPKTKHGQTYKDTDLSLLYEVIEKYIDV